MMMTMMAMMMIIITTTTTQFLQHCKNKGLWPETVMQNSRAAGRRGE
jgi:hypothetical protein